MKIVLAGNVEEGLVAYLQAIVAYRRILRRIMIRLRQEHTEKILLTYFSAQTFSSLVDANSEKFVDRVKFSQLVKHLEGSRGARILNDLYEEFDKDPDLAAFRSLMHKTGNKVIAEDILYFFEHRIKDVRRTLHQQMGALTTEKVSEPAGVLSA